MYLNYIIIIIISYLLGTIPWAMVLVRIVKKKDIRETGSGNIGAMNSFDITGKKWVGIAVFLLDALKGLAAVLVARIITNNDLYSAGLATAFVILGHNYNAFLKLKGGRGLSSAVGALALIQPVAIFLWALMWITAFGVIKKDVHVANITASICAPVLIFNTPDFILLELQTMPFVDLTMFKILCVIVCFLILLRHIEPIKEMINKKKEK